MRVDGLRTAKISRNAIKSRVMHTHAHAQQAYHNKHGIFFINNLHARKKTKIGKNRKSAKLPSGCCQASCKMKISPRSWNNGNTKKKNLLVVIDYYYF